MPKITYEPAEVEDLLEENEQLRTRVRDLMDQQEETLVRKRKVTEDWLASIRENGLLRIRERQRGSEGQDSGTAGGSDRESRPQG